MQKKHYLKEIEIPASSIEIGQKSNEVKRVQEWLNLWTFYDNNWHLEIEMDGDFGPVTQRAVKRFQSFRRIQSDGIVGPHTWQNLTEPMVKAFSEIPFFTSVDLGRRIVEYAKQHLSSHPTEFQPNLGPWVRAYMDGNEGAQWYWCCGFVEAILDMAYSSIQQNYLDHFPNPSYFSCDKVLKYARDNGGWHSNADVKNGNYTPKPGDLFLIISQSNPNDAKHIGVVINCHDLQITTIEGNTNEAGSRNGTVVRMRTRDIKNYLIDIVELC